MGSTRSCVKGFYTRECHPIFSVPRYHKLAISIIYKAAARGITIESVESKLEGDLDARAFLELSKEVRKGYQNIRATFKIKSDASAEELKECAEFSPVLDVITHGTPVSLKIDKA